MSDTVLDRLEQCLHKSQEFNPNASMRPVALLWPDEMAQWQPVVERLAERLPIVTLGEYDPDRRRGPAYWLRCVIAGTIDAGLPGGVPIVYLPRIARSQLRAVDSCPPDLAPIAELQYRSVEFTQPKEQARMVCAWPAGERRRGARV